MNYSVSTLLILFGVVCAAFLITKLLKVEKAAAVFGVGVVVVWLILHFTGYEETINRILFNAPPLQHQSPYNR